ncbi:MAG: hypothetical protein JWN85_3895 [Gammaproteobacteria bacterium]|nr:hypothetical protein [Gammaproteobacteria bacterium]
MSLVEKALRKMQGAPQAAVSELGVAGARRSVDPLLEASRAATAPTAESAPLPAGHRNDKVVAINHTALRTARLLPPEDQERRTAAEYRQIKRPLLAAAFGRGVPAVSSGRAIMIASALPGEGKTFTSINLALSIALEKDTTVLLVDGDVAKSHLSRTFGINDEPGLMDLLQDESPDAASAILPTTMRGLSILPAGQNTATATELLASTRMERLVADLLRVPGRILVFDSPPLLLTTESRALTSVVGQVVVVVRAEETSHKAVLDALMCMGEGRSVGLILNQCQSSPSQAYYGYGEYGQSSDAGSDRR